MAASQVDVVIVGAGAAGLAAARTARRFGLGCVVFEAMDRIGGRAFTSTEPFGAAWDLGCHWLHSADVNPFRLLADEYGFRYRAEPSGWRSFGPDGWASPDQLAEIDAAVEAGHLRAELAGVSGRDVPVSDVSTVDGPAADVFRWEMAAEWGVVPEMASTIDIARYRDSGNDWPVEDGYGALVARHGRGIPVELATPVSRIGWGGGAVRVTTPAGTVEAKSVVVTASTNALASGSIVFDPPLPVWKQEAIAAVPLGLANKVGIAIAGDRLGVDDDTSVLVNVAPGRAISYQLRPFGRDFANAYLAGPICDDLREDGPGAAEAAAIDGLVSVLGSDARRHVGTTAATCWEGEPSILGAYAAARPGSGHRRAELAVALADTVFFAGEAMHPQYFSTCHGADMSGEGAVLAIADRLRRG